MSSVVLAILLIGLLIAEELVRAYYGPERELPGWFRWVNTAVFLLCVGFVITIIQRVLAVLGSI